MADEIVNLNVDVDVKGDNKLLATAAKLTALDAASKRLENRTNRLTGAMGKLNLQMTTTGRGVTKFSKSLTLVEKVGAKFLKMARFLMFSVIALGIEFAVSALSLMSVNAAFIIGKWLASSYNYIMQALAGTVAAVGVAAIGAAAAFKEFQAAQYAFRYKDSKELGSALDQSGSGLRSLYKDATLASMGVQALAGAFAAVNKHSAFTPASKAALKAMADFVQSSGDPQNALQAAGSLVGILQKEKKFTAEALQAVKAISPEFEKAFKKGNYKDYRKFLEDLQSGKLALDAGVSGQSGTMAQTLVGQFRTYLSSALVEMSDVGVRVLEPIKKAMSDIYFGLERTFRRISGDLVSFGQGPFLSSLVKFTEKLEDFTVVLFRKFLPATEGFWRRTTNFFKGFAGYYRELRDALEPLREGGSIVIDTFGKPIGEFFRQIGLGVEALADQAVKYKPLFLEWGESLKSVVVGFFEIMRALREVFARALPLLNPVVAALGKLMSNLASLIDMLSGKTGSGGSSALLALLGVFAFKGRRAYGFKRGRPAGDEFGMSGMSAKQAIYSGHKFSTMGTNVGGGGAANQGQLGSIAGAMSSAGQAAGAAASAAISPGASALTAAGASLQGAAAALTSAALRGGQPIVPGHGLGAQINQNSRGQYLDPVTGKAIDRKIRNDAEYFKHINRNVSASVRNVVDLQTTSPYGPFSSFNQNLANNQIGPVPLGQNMGQYPLSLTAPTTTSSYKTPASGFGLIPQGIQQQIAQSRLPLHGPALNYDAMGASRMSMGQRIKSGVRSSKGLGAVKNFYNNSAFMNGRQLGVTGAMSGVSGTGIVGQQAAGSAFNNTARSGGLRGLVGRTMLGQSYNEGGYRGFRETIRGQSGMGQLGPGNGIMGRAYNSMKGGNFGTGYRNARLNFIDAKRAGLVPANAKFSKLGGIKAGAKMGLSGAGMVAGMGASYLADRYGSEEGKGGMQIGASLAAINPLLGLAVGAGLTAFSSKTKMGGAISGAVSGAAIGGMIAGPFGAAVGGVLGAGLGMIASNRNQKKMAAGAMGKVGLAQISGIAAAAAKEGTSGSTTNARAVLTASKTFASDFAATRKLDDAGKKDQAVAARMKLLQPYIDAGIIDGNEVSLAAGDKNKDAISKIEKTSKTMDQALTPAFNQFDSIMNSLKQTTGMTSEEIYTLAMERNVDLYSTTLKLNDATKALGVGMTKTSKQFTDALRDVQIKAMDVFKRFTESKTMKDALQSSGENLLGGDTSTEAFLDYYTKYQDYANYVSPDSPLLNFIAQSQSLGLGENLGQGNAFQAGGVLSGIVMNDETKGLIGQAQTQTASGSATEMTKQLLAMAGEAGFVFEDGEQAFSGAQTRINEMIMKAAGGDEAATAQVRELEGMLTRGVAFQGKGQDAIASIIGSKLLGSGSLGNNLFGTQLKPELSGELDPFKDILTAEAALMREEFTNAVRQEFFESTDKPKWWDKSPSWWTSGFEVQLKNGVIDKLVPIGDTDTPKVLGKTMGKHGMFDSAVPGKRTVTSSLRNFALGSNNSDHATGHAYDLVGDNLGKYSSLVNASGGFAEFHGTGGARHLHVVPPVGPMGDTSTSILAKMTGSIPSGGSGGGDTFNITVNESSTPQVTARAVANEILQIQRNVKQRI